MDRLLFESRASVLLYHFIKSNFGLNDVVLLPSNVCPIVPAAFLKANVSFEFVDIDDSFLMNKSLVEDQIVKAKGLLFVRSYGVFKDESVWFDYLKHLNKDLIIIDDRCLCIPQFDVNLGNTDLVLFSTGYSKYVDFGWGGYGYMNDSLRYFHENLVYVDDDHDSLQNQFRSCMHKEEVYVDQNSNWLGGIKCLTWEDYKSSVLKGVIKTNAQKEKLNYIYSSGLGPEISLPENAHNWTYNILLKDKSKVIHKVFEADLFVSSHYAPVSNMFSDVNSTLSKKIYDGIVNLFNDFRYSEEQAIKTVEIINKTLLSK